MQKVKNVPPLRAAATQNVQPFKGLLKIPFLSEIFGLAAPVGSDRSRETLACVDATLGKLEPISSWEHPTASQSILQSVNQLNAPASNHAQEDGGIHTSRIHFSLHMVHIKRERAHSTSAALCQGN